MHLPGLPLHILLVEQDEGIRELFTAILTGHGCTVSTATGGGDALDNVQATPPDAIFSSLVFRDMDGFALCRRLRSMPETAHSLIVALTGYFAPGIAEEAKRAGFDEYMLKPAQIGSMLRLLEDFTRRRGRAPAIPFGEDVDCSRFPAPALLQ